MPQIKLFLAAQTVAALIGRTPQKLRRRGHQRTCPANSRVVLIDCTLEFSVASDFKIHGVACSYPKGPLITLAACLCGTLEDIYTCISLYFNSYSSHKKAPTRTKSAVDDLSDIEILALCKTAPNICKPETYDIPGFAPSVLRISPDTVVKIGMVDDLPPAEARSMDVVRTHTSIPVPAVRRYITSGHFIYLAMEYIEGETLHECWHRLSWWRRFRIAWTLRGYIEQLRNIRVKGVEVGPISDSPAKCIGRYFTDYGAGPFSSHAELTAWFIGRYSIVRRQPWYKPSPNTSLVVFDDSEPLVLVHQDLSLRNIMLGSDGKLWLIDWAWAGFYPRWFEYAGMMAYKRDSPSSWTSMIPFIAGFYRKQVEYLGAIGWALVIGARMVA
ncbi:kinase-like protein [Rickenella mellea]|uniref:Kinase-like protein n=1 Tax=Rickenella mellea TaxID=50990 RepID=A0A4Y7Q2R3_9AGAM|nr:kinase-like protein [Rickenella mellea]